MPNANDESYFFKKEQHPHNRQIEFLESEIFHKDQKLESLQAKYESTLKEIRQTKIELSAAKSYINTLPTPQEVMKLKNSLSDLKERKEQKDCDFLKLEKCNSELQSRLCIAQQRIFEYETTLQTKSNEIDALQFTIKLWEKRRRAAKQAGNVTVEDVVAEKMRIQEQLEDMVKIATCREQYLKARIDRMKAKFEDQKCALDEEKKSNGSLSLTILKLEAEVEELRMNSIKLEDTNKCLEDNIKKMSDNLEHFKAREDIRHRTIEDLKRSVVGISKCQRAVDKLIVFMQDAVMKKHLDPSLLFPPCDDSLETTELNDEENLENSVKRRVTDVECLSKKVEICQQTFTNLYVSKLSSFEDNQCHVQ